MKYRRLTNHELEQLKEKFIQFLVSNTVTADDWIKIKEQDLQKAESLIELFSDIVFEDVLKKIELLEFRTPNDLKIFKCNEDHMALRGIRINTSEEFNLLKEGASEVLINKLKNGAKDVQTYHAKKEYSVNREDELFKMMEQGCLISKETQLYNAIDTSK